MTITQPEAKPGMLMEADYGITIDESNLVERISMTLNAYRRQRDRMADIMVQMKRIVVGDCTGNSISID